MIDKDTCYNCQKRKLTAEHESHKSHFKGCLENFDNVRAKMAPSLENIDDLDKSLRQTAKATSQLWDKQFEYEQFDDVFARNC